jgi:hypothetical protein
MSLRWGPRRPGGKRPFVSWLAFAGTPHNLRPPEPVLTPSTPPEAPKQELSPRPAAPPPVPQASLALRQTSFAAAASSQPKAGLPPRPASARGSSSECCFIHNVERPVYPESESPPEPENGPEHEPEVQLVEAREIKRPRIPRRLARHALLCGVCRHEDREAIEAEFIDWRSPSQIAEDYGLHSRTTLYLHARAFGLFRRRRRGVHAVLEHMMEESETVPPSAFAIIQAVKTYIQLPDNDDDDDDSAAGSPVRPRRARIPRTPPKTRPPEKLQERATANLWKRAASKLTRIFPSQIPASNLARRKRHPGKPL